MAQTYLSALTRSIPSTQEAQPVPTGQMAPIAGREEEMKENYAGGFGFQIDPAQQLLRFLVLGSTSNYYKPGEEITMENITSLNDMIAQDRGVEAVDLVRNVYTNGRAAKQDSTLVALAVLCRSDKLEVRKKAFKLVSDLSTLSQLYSFKKFHRAAGTSVGWGRLPKQSFQRWITNKSAQSLAYQVFKYGQREGWTMRDFLRCCHLMPKHLSEEVQLVLSSVVSGFGALENAPDVPVKGYLEAIQELKAMTTEDVSLVSRIVGLVRQHNFPREMLPTWALNHSQVWLALLLNTNGQVVMPMTALIRNLGTMSAHGLFQDRQLVQQVVAKITDKTVIRKSRIHPVSLLTAKLTYIQGRGLKGSQTWSVNSDIADALETALYTSFGNVEPTGLNIFHALDGSGSMGSYIPCMPHMTAFQAVAVLAMTFARSEDPSTQDFGVFTRDTGYDNYGWRSNGFSWIGLTPTMRLEDSVRILNHTNWGGTDCSLPVKTAIKEFHESGKIYDVFIIYTDNDTWAGDEHVNMVLERYRAMVGKPVKLVVVATTASGVTVADPKDPNSLELVGFDSHAPQILGEFLRGFEDPEWDMV